LLKKSGELFQSSPKLDDIYVSGLQQSWAGISQRLRREFVSAACNNGIPDFVCKAVAGKGAPVKAPICSQIMASPFPKSVPIGYIDLSDVQRPEVVVSALPAAS
jgi:hypothetical protein